MFLVYIEQEKYCIQMVDRYIVISFFSYSVLTPSSDYFAISYFFECIQYPCYPISLIFRYRFHAIWLNKADWYFLSFFPSFRSILFMPKSNEPKM